MFIPIPHLVLDCNFCHYEPYYNNVLHVMSALIKVSKVHNQQYTTYTKHNGKLKIACVWCENVDSNLCTMKSHHRKIHVRRSYECGDCNCPAEALYDVNLHHKNVHAYFLLCFGSSSLSQWTLLLQFAGSFLFNDSQTPPLQNHAKLNRPFRADKVRLWYVGLRCMLG